MFNFLKVSLVALVMAFAVSACGGSDAKGTVDDYINALYSNDVSELKSLVNLEGVDKDPSSKQMVDGKLNQASKRAIKVAERKGGFDKHEVVSIEKDPNDATKSVANVKIYFNDGTTVDKKLKLVEIDGKFKIDMKM